MAALVKTPAGTWKAVVRKNGWPTTSKTFRTKRDAQDWARGTEDEMVRGVYISRRGAERLTLDQAMARYLREVSPTKHPGSAIRDQTSADALLPVLGQYALVALTPDVVAAYRVRRLEAGKAPDTVRLELALLSHVFTTAIREWRLGLLPASAWKCPKAADLIMHILRSSSSKNQIGNSSLFGFLRAIQLIDGCRVRRPCSLARFVPALRAQFQIG